MQRHRELEAVKDLSDAPAAIIFAPIAERAPDAAQQRPCAMSCFFVAR
jgi:hypothetical protein